MGKVSAGASGFELVTLMCTLLKPWLFVSLICAEVAGFQKIFIEGDSLLIIKCIKGDCITPWRLQTVIKDIVNLAKDFEDVQFKHIYREANFVADRLDSLGHASENLRIWNNTLPTAASGVHSYDISGNGFSGAFL